MDFAKFLLTFIMSNINNKKIEIVSSYQSFKIGEVYEGGEDIR